MIIYIVSEQHFNCSCQDVEPDLRSCTELFNCNLLIFFFFFLNAPYPRSTLNLKSALVRFQSAIFLDAPFYIRLTRPSIQERMFGQSFINSKRKLFKLWDGRKIIWYQCSFIKGKMSMSLFLSNDPFCHFPQMLYSERPLNLLECLSNVRNN